MIQELKEKVRKSVGKNVEQLAIHATKLSVSLVSFVISCWLVIGAIGLGFVAPVYVVTWVLKASVGNEVRVFEETFEDEVPSIGSLDPVYHPRWVRPVTLQVREARPERPASMRTALRETTGTVSEVRRLARGFESFANR